MNIVICISNVPDTTTRVKFVDDYKKLDTSGIQWVINPWDELSLTRALDLKDDPASGIGKVTVAHVGPVANEPTIRKALAIGADDAIRVNAEASDAWFVAFQLATALKSHPFDIIICGIESCDFNGSIVGGMLAEFLEIPSVSSVSSLRIEDGKSILTREIDGGKEVMAIPTPFVAIVQKGIAKEPRIASMRGIMMARSKPIRIVEPAPMNPMTEVIQFEKPQSRAACKFIDPENPGLLVEMLQNEAKILS
jgi:electron transfer flavoprotein beta subunit